VIAGVVGCVLGIFLFRNLITGKLGAVGGGIIAAVVNSTEIQILNVFYGKLSVWLNDYENHRTPTEYENALIGKSFLFKFVNSYNSLFYVAFFKQYEKDPAHRCPSGDPFCLGELRTQLATIFIMGIVVNNGIEFLTPVINNYLKAKDNAAVDASGVAKPKTQPELEYELDPFESTFDDFDEMVVQFGYVVLFVVSFPLAPLLAMVNNFIEIRLDAKKVSDFSRRPEPEGATTIGTWFDILTIVSIIAVATNAALCIFYTKAINNAVKADSTSRLLTFLIAEHMIFLFKFLLSYFIPDEPNGVETHIARQKHLVECLIEGKEDENDDDLLDMVVGAEGKPFNWAEVPLQPRKEDYAFFLH